MQGLNRVAHNGGNASGWETLEKRCLTSLVVKDFARKPTWHRFRCTRHKLLSLRVDRGRREVDPTFAVKLPWLQGFSSRAQNVSRSSVCTSSKIQIQQCLLSILCKRKTLVVKRISTRTGMSETVVVSVPAVWAPVYLSQRMRWVSLCTDTEGWPYVGDRSLLLRSVYSVISLLLANGMEGNTLSYYSMYMLYIIHYILCTAYM